MTEADAKPPPPRPGLSKPPPGGKPGGAMAVGAQKNLLGAEGNLHLKNKAPAPASKVAQPKSSTCSIL